MDNSARIEHLRELMATRPGLKSSVNLSREIRLLDNQEREGEQRAEEAAAPTRPRLAW